MAQEKLHTATRDVGRRVGEEAVLNAAADLIVEGALEQYLAFAGVRAVARKAKVTPTTVVHRFGKEHTAARGLALAATRHALARSGLSQSYKTVSELEKTVDGLRDGDPAALERVYAAAVKDIIAFSGDEQLLRSDTAGWIAVAASPQDPDAREILREHYNTLLEAYAPIFESLAEATGRRFIASVSARQLSVAMTALADGFIARRRFSPEVALPETFGRMAIGMFVEATVPLGTDDEPAPGERLLSDLPEPARQVDLGGRDPDKRLSIERAVRTLYFKRHAWDDVTVLGVARLADVSKSTIMANFADRNALAAVPWTDWALDFEADFEKAKSGRAFRRVLDSYLVAIAKRAVVHRELTGALLHSVFDFTIVHGPPNYEEPPDPRDPRALVPLPRPLRPFLVAHADRFRKELVNRPDWDRWLAAHLVNTTLHAVMTRVSPQSGSVTEMESSAEAVVGFVLDVTLAGVLDGKVTGSRADRKPGA
ncbi:MAG: hypothetical protein Q8K58_03925 [Acidimicrobiales bacterium]|nr:hypothetical protein [Acidimicrobiales bacterium]